MKKMFETVAIGGTFDLFHSGHLALLLKAFEVGDHVVIGLCSDAFLEKMNKPHEIASYVRRLEELQNFLKTNSFLERAEIVSLNDAYGVTLSDKRIDAIVVS